jgi:hypothetical protein
MLLFHSILLQLHITSSPTLFFDKMSNQIDIIEQLQQKLPLISNQVKDNIR